MYNRREKEENIKKGTSENYFAAEGLAESFEKFIDDTIAELSEFPADLLKSKGITIEDDRTSILVRFKPQAGVQFQIIKFYNNLSYRVSQHGETPSMGKIRELSMGAICGMKQTMYYSSDISPVMAGYPDRMFRFDAEETDGKKVGNYIDGFLPSPDKKVVYFEPNEQYSVFSRNYGEFPKSQYKRLPNGNYELIGYVNQDESKAESKPFIATTYPSFEEGQADMDAKLEAFKDAFRKVLTELNEATTERAPQFAKTENH